MLPLVGRIKRAKGNILKLSMIYVSYFFMSKVFISIWTKKIRSKHNNTHDNVINYNNNKSNNNNNIYVLYLL